MILRRLTVLLFFFAAFFSLFFNAGWDIWAQSLIHLLTLAILTLFLARAAWQKREITFSYTPADVWFLLYLAGLSLSYFYSVNRFNTRNELFNHFNYYLFFYLCPLLLAEDSWRALFLRLLGLAAGFIALIVLWQVWSGQQIIGPLLNANIAGGLFIMVIPILISRVAAVNRQKMALVSCLPEIVLTALILGGLLAARSLGAWLSLFFSMALFTILLPKKYILPGILLGIAVFCCFLAIKLKEPGVFNRVWWWKGALSMIRDHPLMGVGLGNFEGMYLVYKTAGLNSLYTHNHYLQFWAESGVFNLLFWLLGVYAVIRCALVKLLEQEPPKQYLILALICAISGLLVYSLIDYSFAIPAIAIIWWVLFGLLRPFLPAKTITFRIGAYSRLAYLFTVIILSIVAVKPFFASQRYVSGIAYLRQNDLAAANKMMNSSIALDPLNAQAYGFLSDIAKKEGDLSTAVGYLRQAISLNKYFGPFHHNLALLYETQGNLPQAIMEAEKALACHRQKPLYHYTLSLLYKKAGRIIEAEEEYRQYQGLLPHD